MLFTCKVNFKESEIVIKKVIPIIMCCKSHVDPFIEPKKLVFNDLYLFFLSVSLKAQQITPLQHNGHNDSSQVEATKEGNPSTTVCDSQEVR